MVTVDLTQPHTTMDEAARHPSRSTSDGPTPTKRQGKPLYCFFRKSDTSSAVWGNFGLHRACRIQIVAIQLRLCQYGLRWDCLTLSQGLSPLPDLQNCESSIPVASSNHLTTPRSTPTGWFVIFTSSFFLYSFWRCSDTTINKLQNSAFLFRVGGVHFKPNTRPFWVP